MTKPRQKQGIAKIASVIEYLHRPTLCLDLEGRILTCNARCAQIIGFRDKREVEGREALDFIAIEDRETVLSHYEKILLGTGSVIYESYPLITRTGKKVEKEVSGSLLQTNSGIPYGLLVTIEKKNGNQHFSSFNYERIRSFTHELRSPLNAITGFVQLLENDAYIKSQYTSYLENVNEGVMNMVKTIENFTTNKGEDLGGIDSAKDEFPVETVFNYIEMMIKMMGSEAGTSTTYRRNSSVKGETIVSGDLRLVKQLVLNVLTHIIYWLKSNQVEYGGEIGKDGELIFFVRDNETEKTFSFNIPDIGYLN